MLVFVSKSDKHFSSLRILKQLWVQFQKIIVDKPITQKQVARADYGGASPWFEKQIVPHFRPYLVGVDDDHVVWVISQVRLSYKLLAFLLILLRLPAEFNKENWLFTSKLVIE